MYDLIIIGMGIGGITAGIYAKRGNLNVLMLESSMPGGMLNKIEKISNYPGLASINGSDFATKLFDQVKELEIPYKFEEVIDTDLEGDIKKIITSKGVYEAKSVIIATGSKPKYLGLDNEKDLVGRGISTCATCDGAFYKNKDVAVNGGGNTALEDALYLSDVAHTVYLIHRRDEFRAEDVLVNKLKERENVKFVLNSNIIKLNAGERLESIDVIDKDGNVQTINVSGLFIAIGRVPENQNFAKIITLDDAGYVIAGED